MTCLQRSTKVAFDYKFSTFEWHACKGPPKSPLIINSRPFDGFTRKDPQKSPFDYKFSTFEWFYPQRAHQSRLSIMNFRPLDGFTRKGPPKSHLIINFDLWMACPCRYTKAAFDYKFSTFGWFYSQGSTKVAFRS